MVRNEPAVGPRILLKVAPDVKYEGIKMPQNGMAIIMK